MGVVYTIAFRSILQIRNENFVFYLMLGLLAWTFFASSAAMSTGSIADNGGLVKSVWFPRAILPIATVLFNLTQYILSVSVILPLMLIYYRVTPEAPMLLFPVFVALQVLFTIGVALSLATATAFLRDVRHLVEIAITILFWMTPVVYQLRELSAPLRRVLLLSPMSPYVDRVSADFLLSSSGRTPPSGSRLSLTPLPRWPSVSGSSSATKTGSRSGCDVAADPPDPMRLRACPS